MDGTANRLALAALVNGLPVSTVEAALDGCGRVGQRVRTLPPWVTTYHVLTSAMLPTAGYDEVTALLWSTLPAATGRGLARQPPSRGAVTRARERLGVEPLEALLAELLAEAADRPPPDRIYLQKVESPPAGLWWACDAGTGALRGCVVRCGADDDAAALDVVERARPRSVVVCPPYRESTLRTIARISGSVPVSVGELPDSLVGPWAGLRARSTAAWAQDAMARACVRVVEERALADARQARARALLSQ